MGLEEKKMPFNLFHKKKQPEQEKPAVPPQEIQAEAPVQTQEETPSEPVTLAEEPVQEPAAQFQSHP